MTTVIDVPGNSAGDMNGDGSRKALLHSTEGSSWENAVATYKANNSWPTKTVDLKRRIIVRHLPLSVAARSLRNESGGVETNKDGTILIQYELIGFADQPDIGSTEDWEWFGREVLGPDCRATGVPIRSTVSWVDYPASYGVNASQRLASWEWDEYSGILGHQHATENSHGDPGAIPIAIAINAALGVVPPPTTWELDMPYPVVKVNGDSSRPPIALTPKGAIPANDEYISVGQSLGLLGPTQSTSARAYDVGRSMANKIASGDQSVMQDAVSNVVTLWEAQGDSVLHSIVRSSS